jgi:RHS repeat-associated protein
MGLKNPSKTYTADDERVVAFNRSTGRATYRLRSLAGQVLREMTLDNASSFWGGEEPLQAPVWSWEKDWVYRGSQLLGAVARDPEGGPDVKLHYHLDHLGTPRGVTQETAPGEGEGVGAYHYWPYGTPGPTSNLAPFAELVRDQVVPGAFDPATEVMRFTGHERDFGSVAGTEDDLDYMHARFYRPGWGRFLSVDPVSWYKPSPNPQRWNRYSYTY